MSDVVEKKEVEEEKKEEKKQNILSTKKGKFFWLSFLAIAISAIISSGLLDGFSIVEKILGAVMIILTSLGYTAGRVVTIKKKEKENDKKQ